MRCTVELCSACVPAEHRQSVWVSTAKSHNAHRQCLFSSIVAQACVSLSAQLVSMALVLAKPTM
eukprot:14583820-Alexandrium_andersonii.AAC.1